MLLNLKVHARKPAADFVMLYKTKGNVSICFYCSYGDTAPKSVPARLYSILWMLLGMVAFSVLTANFTSSLTHEIEEDLTLFGKKVNF